MLYHPDLFCNWRTYSSSFWECWQQIFLSFQLSSELPWRWPISTPATAQNGEENKSLALLSNVTQFWRVISNFKITVDQLRTSLRLHHSPASPSQFYFLPFFSCGDTKSTLLHSNLCLRFFFLGTQSCALTHQKLLLWP